MATHKRNDKKRRRHGAARERDRVERRFVPSPTETTSAPAYAGMAASLLLGVGVYGRYLSDSPPAHATGLVVVGALGVGAALMLGDRGVYPVRIGDFGVAIEKGHDVVRVLWCDVSRISVEGERLVIKGHDTDLSIPLAAHATAAAHVLQQTARRIPSRLDVSPKLADSLPKPGAEDGERIVIDALQVAGKRCAASGETLSYERDARLCPGCVEIYHKDHVPKTCVTCQKPLGDAATVA